MPTIVRIGPYRCYFWSHELNEPPHIHVDRDERSAKFWLRPISLANNIGFKPHELRKIESIVVEHQDAFLEAWNEHFHRDS
jgi:hypothetical protein